MRKGNVKFGYVRVSTKGQNPESQRKALEDYGINHKNIFIDIVSGAKFERPSLDKLMKDILREGDTLVVWKIDRLSRSLLDLIKITNKLNEMGVEFVSLTENIDTTTTMGKFMFHLFGILAEFERNCIRERTRAGLEAARARGRKGGTKYKLNKAQLRQLKAMHKDINISIDEIAQTFKISRVSVFRYLKMNEEDLEK